MEGLLFGTAGTPISSNGTGSLSGIKRVHELGLGCMELEFVRGVKMGEDTARKVSVLAKKLYIGLSVHAPYYICLLYTSDAADDLLCVDLGGRRIIKKKKKNK